MPERALIRCNAGAEKMACSGSATVPDDDGDAAAAAGVAAAAVVDAVELDDRA